MMMVVMPEWQKILHIYICVVMFHASMKETQCHNISFIIPPPPPQFISPATHEITNYPLENEWGHFFLFLLLIISSHLSSRPNRKIYVFMCPSKSFSRSRCGGSQNVWPIWGLYWQMWEYQFYPFWKTNPWKIRQVFFMWKNGLNIRKICNTFHPEVPPVRLQYSYILKCVSLQ